MDLVRWARARARRITAEVHAGSDAVARAEGYQSAGHKRRSAAGKLERQRRTPADQIARAKSVGLVARAEYLGPEGEARALRQGPNGLIDARLERVRDRLLVVTPLGWINPKSRTAHRAGLHSFQIKGTSHYKGSTTGRFTPGARLRLVREPHNPHDPNAIAIFAMNDRHKAGYVPARRAKRLAQLMDTGVELVGISVRGAGPGRNSTIPQVLICERRLFDHLTRRA